MSALRSRNAVLLAKIETTEGTDASPSASTDAILVENPKIKPSINLINTNEVTGTLDGAGPIVGGMKMDISFDVLLKGSGSAGVAPEYGDLLKAAGWVEVLTTTAIPVSAEAAGAGSATSLTLGTSAGTTAQAYRGMPLLLTTNPAAGATTFISDYTAGKVSTLTDSFSPVLDSTTNYQIPRNVLYKPGSTSIPSLTMYLYVDGILYKLVGARGTGQTSVGAGGIGMISFTFTGMFLSKTDAAVPTATYDTARPPVFKNNDGKAAMLINRLPAALKDFSIDFGNKTTNPENPNALEGFDPAIITERDITGSVNPLETLVATRDIMGDLRNGTTRIIHARWGTVIGNRIGITIPAALFTNQDMGDRNGLANVDVPFSATGKEAGAFLCFY